MALRRLLCSHQHHWSLLDEISHLRQCLLTANVRSMSKKISSEQTNNNTESSTIDKEITDDFPGTPSSFDIIHKFPLNPDENKDWSEESMDFKHEVEQLNMRSLPSVKTILNKTMSDDSRGFLDRWKEKMINEVGEKGYQKYMKAAMANGKNLHHNIEQYFQGKPVPKLKISKANEGHWESLQPALKTIGDVRALEVDIMHPNLMYGGVFDCIAMYRDMLVLIDWKTSKQPRPLLKFTYDDPLQVAAYMGAVNADPYYKKKYGEVRHGMLVVAYPTGRPAHVHLMNPSYCEHYWKEWRSRLHEFYQQSHRQTHQAKGK